MSLVDKPNPEHTYFDIPEVSLEAAPVRIPHKCHFKINGYGVFVHLLGLGTELREPEWAVGVEVLKGSMVVIPLMRLEVPFFFSSREQATQAGIEFGVALLNDTNPLQ